MGVIASSSLTGFAPQGQLGSALLGELFTGATVGEALLGQSAPSAIPMCGGVISSSGTRACG
ncbi:MAG TPA: hypothetical protein VKF36_18845 [Syntrophorhabdales bacterium]|nr:hypothetical protein [Syntrophorhabdales bacterium]